MAIFCELPAVAKFQLGSLCYLRSPCSLVSLGDTRRTTADYDLAVQSLSIAACGTVKTLVVSPCYQQPPMLSEPFRQYHGPRRCTLDKRMFTPSSAERHRLSPHPPKLCYVARLTSLLLPTTTTCPSLGPAASPWIHHQERRADLPTPSNHAPLACTSASSPSCVDAAQAHYVCT